MRRLLQSARRVVAGRDVGERLTLERRPVSGYARGAYGVDWESRIDFDRLRRGRIEAVRAALLASDLDGLLLWKDENVRYLTSLRAQLIAGHARLILPLARV